MAGNLTTEGEDAVLAHIATWPLQLGLVTALGGDATGGTEVSGGGYVRQGITLSTPAGGTIGHTNSMTFTLPACTVVGGEVWNTSTGKRVMHGPLPKPITTAAGATITFDPGDLSFDMT
jgi:hypothetical protein